MRAQEFMLERKKKKKASRRSGGYFFPGYGYYGGGGDAGEGGGDGGGGESKNSMAKEPLDELNFLGSQCTKDCSGHRAGYDWSKRKGLRQANSYSPSFNKGAGLAVAGK